MDDQESKKYTLQARTGVKGEAFFEHLMAEYALPHQIVGPKDIGVDYICEWAHGDEPTGILYAVQVKTFSHKTATPRLEGVDKKRNGLERYKITNSKLNIDDKTLRYWRGLGMPVYLFAIVHTAGTAQQDERFDCYYKRFAAVLTTTAEQKDQPFYHANSVSKFRAFADDQDREGGFARDLYFDYMRCSYFKGSITYLDPLTLGLNPLSLQDTVFTIVNDYREQVLTAYEFASEWIGVLYESSGDATDGPHATPTAAPDEEYDEE